MYIDPSLGAPLLEPLFRLQASPNYTIPFAATDLGGSRINVNVEGIGTVYCRIKLSQNLRQQFESQSGR
jgi:hypothetical protein